MANVNSNLVPSIAQGLSINSSGGLVKSPTPNVSVSSGPVTMSGIANPGSVAQGLSINSSGNVVKNAQPSVAVSTGPVAFSGAPSASGSGIASQTHTDAQGNSVKTTYQPAPPSQNASATVDNSGGTANANYNLQIPTGGSTGIAPTPSTAIPTSATPSSTPASNTPTAPGLLSTVAGFANTDPGLQDLYGKEQALQADYASRYGGILNTPTTLNEQTGRLSALQNEENSAQSNLASNYQANLAQRGQNIGAAESALGTATNLQSSPYGQPLVNPATGQVISGGQNVAPNGSGSGGAIQPNDPAYSALQQYAQMAAQGENSAIPSAWTSNPVLNAQINSMAQQINPNYNPLTTPLTTQAIATQNASQGATYQAQSQEISNALQTMAPITQTLSQFMSSNQLNPSGIPLANTQINKINSQTNPAAVATMNAAISDIRSYAIQILGAQSGANPTDVTNSVNSFDFSNFTPQQLQTFANNLSTLGQYRLSQAQSASSAGYGANQTSGAVNPAQGITATPGSALQTGGANLLNNIPAPAKLWLGGASSIGSDVLNSLGGLAGSVVSGAAGGAAESGLASTVLGI